MQIRQRIFKHTAMQVLCFFSRQNLQTFDISHAFLALTTAKLSTFKKCTFFWPTLYIVSHKNVPLDIIAQPVLVGKTSRKFYPG